MTDPRGLLHIVLVEWAAIDESTIRSIREAARGLAEQIPGITSITEGPSVSPEGLEDGLDWGMIVAFTDADARDAYLPHPQHQVVADLLRRHSARVVVFDV
jgi:hypothetical protein